MSLTSILVMMAMALSVGCAPEVNNDPELEVITYMPYDITSMSVVCGGHVGVIQGLQLSQLGVCWSETPEPTVECSHLSTTNWSDPFVCTIMWLRPSTKYYVRAYALRGIMCYYGNEKCFTTKENNGGSWNGHDYVDLGLPSGTLWATCNVGAYVPEGYGDYYAWGETVPKNTYSWATYKYVCGNDPSFGNELTKYCTSSLYGYNGFTDDLITLQQEDDAAVHNWGNGWFMPSYAQWTELYQRTTHTRITLNGQDGELFTAANGTCLFLPFSDLERGYWSSSLNTDLPFFAQVFRLEWCGLGNDYRANGHFVRPVRLP